jgi:hypothetical protein
MSGAIFPLPDTPTTRGSQLKKKQRVNFNFTSTFITNDAQGSVYRDVYCKETFGRFVYSKPESRVLVLAGQRNNLQFSCVVQLLERTTASVSRHLPGAGIFKW